MKKFNLFPIVLAAIGFLALLGFCFLGVAHIQVDGGAEGGILGFLSTFAIDFKYIGGKQVILRGVNWWGLAVMLLTILASVCTGFLTKKHRAWYYVSSVLAVIAVFIVFFYHRSLVTMNSTNSFRVVKMGAGQFVSGILLSIMAIGNIFAAYQDKQTA